MKRTYDKKETKRFLSILSGGRDNEPHFFQTFLDDKSVTINSKPNTFLKSIDAKDLYSTLKELNKGGHGIFVTVHEMDDSGNRTKNNCTKIRGIPLDFDKCLPSHFHLEPTMIVSSSGDSPKGHAYWLFSEPVPMTNEEYLNLWTRFYEHYKADQPDAACKDTARVLRVPGFYNKKPEYGGFAYVSIKEASEKYYSIEQMTEGLPEATAVSVSAKRTGSNESFKAESWSKIAANYRANKIPKDKSLKEKTNVMMRKHFALAIANGGGMHKAIGDSGLCCTRFALAYGIDKAYDLMKAQADAAYAKLGREANERVNDDKRYFAWGLQTGLASELEDAAKFTQMRELTGTEVDVQWASEAGLFAEDAQIYALQSYTGSGKTKLIIDYISKIPKDESFIVISHRVTLLAQWHGSIAPLNVDFYKDDASKLQTSHRLICSYDSLNKLRGRMFDHVILDETDEGFAHALSGQTSIRNFRRQTIEALKILLYNAERIVMVSAFLSNTEVDMVKALAESDDVRAIINTRQPKHRQYFRYDSKAVIEQALWKALADDKSIMVMCDSSKNARMLYEKAKELFGDSKKFKLVNRDTDDKHEMDLPNKYFAGYDAVFCSPTAFTGVDINDPKLYHAVFGMFTNTLSGIGIYYLIQAMNRIRTPMDNECHVFVADDFYKMESPDGESALIKANAKEADLKQFVNLSKDGSALCESTLLEAYKTYEHFLGQYLQRAEVESSRRFTKFWSRIEKQGHTIVNVSECDANDIVKVSGDKDVREALREADCLAVLNAAIVDSETANELLAKHDRKKDEQNSLERYFAQLAHEKLELNEKLMLHYQRSSKMLALLLQRFHMLPPVAAKKDEYFMKQFRYDRQNYVDKHRFAEELLALVASIVNKKFSASTLAGEWLEFQKANEKHIAEYGVKVANSQPVVTFSAVLKMLEYTVECNKERDGDKIVRSYRAIRKREQEALYTAMYEAAKANAAKAQTIDNYLDEEVHPIDVAQASFATMTDSSDFVRELVKRGYCEKADGRWEAPVTEEYM